MPRPESGELGVPPPPQYGIEVVDVAAMHAHAHGPRGRGPNVAPRDRWRTGAMLSPNQHGVAGVHMTAAAAAPPPPELTRPMVHRAQPALSPDEEIEHLVGNLSAAEAQPEDAASVPRVDDAQPLTRFHSEAPAPHAAEVAIPKPSRPSPAVQARHMSSSTDPGVYHPLDTSAQHQQQQPLSMDAEAQRTGVTFSRRIRGEHVREVVGRLEFDDEDDVVAGAGDPVPVPVPVAAGGRWGAQELAEQQVRQAPAAPTSVPSVTPRDVLTGDSGLHAYPSARWHAQGPPGRAAAVPHAAAAGVYPQAPKPQVPAAAVDESIDGLPAYASTSRRGVSAQATPLDVNTSYASTSYDASVVSSGAPPPGVFSVATPAVDPHQAQYRAAAVHPEQPHPQASGAGYPAHTAGVYAAHAPGVAPGVHALPRQQQPYDEGRSRSEHARQSAPQAAPVRGEGLLDAGWDGHAHGAAHGAEPQAGVFLKRSRPAVHGEARDTDMQTEELREWAAGLRRQHDALLQREEHCREAEARGQEQQYAALALDSKEKELRVREAALGNMLAEVKAREAAVARRAETAEHQAKDAQDLFKALEDKSARLNQKVYELQAREDVVAAREVQADKLDEQQHRKAEELLSFNKVLTEKMQALDVTRQNLDTWQRDLDYRSQKHELKDIALRDEEDRLQQVAEHLRQNQRDIESKFSILRHMDRTAKMGATAQAPHPAEQAAQHPAQAYEAAGAGYQDVAHVHPAAAQAHPQPAHYGAGDPRVQAYHQYPHAPMPGHEEEGEVIAEGMSSVGEVTAPEASFQSDTARQLDLDTSDDYGADQPHMMPNEYGIEPIRPPCLDPLAPGVHETAPGAARAQEARGTYPPAPVPEAQAPPTRVYETINAPPPPPPPRGQAVQVPLDATAQDPLPREELPQPSFSPRDAPPAAAQPSAAEAAAHAGAPPPRATAYWAPPAAGEPAPQVDVHAQAAAAAPHEEDAKPARPYPKHYEGPLHGVDPRAVPSFVSELSESANSDPTPDSNIKVRSSTADDAAAAATDQPPDFFTLPAPKPVNPAGVHTVEPAGAPAASADPAGVSDLLDVD